MRQLDRETYLQRARAIRGKYESARPDCAVDFGPRFSAIMRDDMVLVDDPIYETIRTRSGWHGERRKSRVRRLFESIASQRPQRSRNVPSRRDRPPVGRDRTLKNPDLPRPCSKPWQFSRAGARSGDFYRAARSRCPRPTRPSSRSIAVSAVLPSGHRHQRRSASVPLSGSTRPGAATPVGRSWGDCWPSRHLKSGRRGARTRPRRGGSAGPSSATVRPVSPLSDNH